MIENNLKYAVVTKASGFTGQTFARTFEKKIDALTYLSESFDDFRKNPGDHAAKPTVYVRIEPEVLTVIDFS